MCAPAELSAPGKAFVAGEYSVLERGEPALVLAVEVRLQVALRLEIVDTGDRHAEPDLGGVDATVSRRRRNRALERLVEHVLKVDAAGLEAGSVDDERSKTG